MHWQYPARMGQLLTIKEGQEVRLEIPFYLTMLKDLNALDWNSAIILTVFEYMMIVLVLLFNSIMEAMVVSILRKLTAPQVKDCTD